MGAVAVVVAVAFVAADVVDAAIAALMVTVMAVATAVDVVEAILTVRHAEVWVAAACVLGACLLDRIPDHGPLFYGSCHVGLCYVCCCMLGFVDRCHC
jgi:hypothetical protein